jgi:hypothetical protein|tara:strand:- start:489 stop:632 length:144 start_codon:yes stop_codon:yes gene_type:complete
VLLAAAADEPNLVNTVKHIKDIVNFAFDAPSKLKYVYVIKLKLEGQK